MRVNLRVSAMLVMVSVLLLSTSLTVAAESDILMRNSAAVFTTINFVSNIETIGVAVSGTGLPSTAELSYRRSGETPWHSGHRLMRIDDGRLFGSLFNLLPATSYEIKVFDGSSEIIGLATTQPDQLSFTPSVILHVNDDALPGGNGSVTSPFKTIQEAVNHAEPGTQVLVADGTYREAVTFPASGTPGNWIQVKAAGNAAILDSADRLSGNIWTQTSTTKVWFTKISGPVAYLARGGNRFYQYDDKNGLMQARGHGGVTINEGWFYEPGTSRLYVRSLQNPANYTWRVPRLNHAFDIAARDWLWIEGFEIRFYGTTTNGCGVCTINASHLVIRRNKIHNMQLGIFINWNGTDSQGNDTRIEQNEVHDPLVNEWPWAAVKGSFMEGTGIIVRGHVGAIVRDNNVHNFFNGIYTGSSGALENSELAFDTDIYNNNIHHVSDDGLEPEGACINQRFRNNTVDRSFIGISLAPITQGPTWVLHSTFANFTGRGIKFADDSDGIVLIYQNTAWTSAANINGMDLITPVHNVKMRNNIFQSTGYSFAEVPTGSTANDWNNNNWYTTRSSAGPHFKWENINYNTISALCAASGLECNGHESMPGFVNPAGGDFALLPTSPNIDRGVLLPGINDGFVGNAPDVGAYELGVSSPPIVGSSVRADPDPTNAAAVDFTITFSKPVTGVDESDFRLTTTGVTGAVVSTVSGSGTAYSVTVNTGTGDGTIRLDVKDDNTIIDAAGNPLGGSNVGDGTFTNGEVYTVIKSSNVAVDIGGDEMGTYIVPASSSSRGDFPGVNNGPVNIIHLNGRKIIASQRVIFGGKSYSEMMGLPAEQLSQEYWFPYYNNVAMDSQLRASNLGDVPTTITVTLGNTEIDSYTLAAGAATRKNYAGQNSGPLKVHSSATDILSTVRVLYGGTSYSELMGLPVEQLTNEYLFPYYNNVAMDSQLRVSNLGDVPTTITVTLGITEIDSYVLAANGATRKNYPGMNSGPLKVHSSDTDILSTIRVLYKAKSYSELMGFPANELAKEYWYPVYDNVALDSQLRVSNVGAGSTTITIKLGGVQIDSYTLAAGAATRKNYALKNAGPLQVISSAEPILTTVRMLYNTPTFSSLYEMTGLPDTQLSTWYYFPWYNNTAMNSELRFAAP